jgi:hypothetical protein
MAESSGCLQQNSWARPREDGMQRSWVEGSAAFSKITLLTFLECAESRATNQLPLGSGEDTCASASSPAALSFSVQVQESALTGSEVLDLVSQK